MKLLSAAAQSTLINARAARVGASIPARTGPDIVQELMDAGMIGAGMGLTEYGVIARDALLAARLSAFGG